MADLFSFPEERFVLIGKIGKPQGLRGEVRLHAFSDTPETLLQYGRVVLVDGSGGLSPVLEIERARRQGRGVVYKFAAIDDRDAAEAIYGLGILLAKEDLPEVEEGEYYWHRLYNVAVVTETGESIGKVHTIFSNGAQDIMVIRESDREYLVPFIDSIVVQYSDSEIVISPPPGLLEINTGTEE